VKLILAVALGGAVGSVARHLVTGHVTRLVDGTFPWGTLAVNVIGGFVMGALAETMALVWSPSATVRAMVPRT
jgi:CrcB protein